MAKKSTQYVDGYVIPISKKKIGEYRRMAQIGRKVWLRHGALDYRECVGDDLKVGFGRSFLKGIKVKPGETVLFSYIVFRSRAHRDKVNAAVMKDPDLCAGMDPTNMPFDANRMLVGGFATLVGL